MNVKKILILNVLIIYTLNISAQFYSDRPYLWLTNKERSNAKKYGKRPGKKDTYSDLPYKFITDKERKNAKKYGKRLGETNKYSRNQMMPIILVETNDFVRVDIDSQFINFAVYNTSCDRYFSPVSRRKCRTKVGFLLQAYDATNSVLNSYRFYELYTNRGLEQQISLKYASIIMNIQFELDKIREQATKGLGLEPITP